MKNSAIVTDARIGACLCISRSLGKKKVNVYCGTDKDAMEGNNESRRFAAISSYSRHVKQVFYYPDPSNQTAFEQSIDNISRKLDVNIIMPVAQRTTIALSKAKERLKHLIIPVSDYQNLRVAASKKHTIQLAKKLNIPTPNTLIVNSLADLENHDFKFPLVVKGVHGSGLVTYVHNLKSLKSSVEALYELQGEYPLIQEYVDGQGYGFFALFNKGQLRATFMHKRIREYPASGGMSTCAESVYERKLQDYGLKLLTALDWHGVAMVEFKKDVHENQFKLMEINPRFWGSLDLPVASGIDFPHMLYKMAADGDVKPDFTYRKGLRYAWFPLDLVRVFKDRASAHLKLKPFISDLLNPANSFNIQKDDLNPSSIQLMVAFNHFYDMGTAKLKNRQKVIAR